MERKHINLSEQSEMPWWIRHQTEMKMRATGNAGTVPRPEPLTIDTMAAEGWEYEGMRRNGEYLAFTQGPFVLEFYPPLDYIIITQKFDRVRYDGYCRDMDELRLLSEMIGIDQF